MSELDPDQLDAIRQHYTYDEPDGMVVLAVRMALRTYETERKNAQLREALTDARTDTWYAWLREGDNSSQAEARLAKIDEALATPPNKIEPLCDECATEVDCALRDDRSCDFPEAPEQTDKDRDEIENGQHPEPIEYEPVQTSDDLEAAERDPLPVGKAYYVPDPLNKEYLAREETWRGDGQDHYYLASGLVYLRKNEAGRVAKRMLPTMGYFNGTGGDLTTSAAP